MAMFGLFGSGSGSRGSQAPGAMYDPSNLSGADRMSIFGAMLKDIGNGGQSNNVSDVRQMLMQRQLMGAQLGMMGQALGPDDGSGASAQQPAAAPVPSGPTPPGAPPAGPFGTPMAPQGPAPGPAPPQPGGMFANRQQKALAAMALLKGDAKGAWDIMHPSIKIGPDGTPYNENDPATLAMRFGNPANVNGTVINMNDPANNNRAVPAAPIPGAMPVYDNLGHVVDWSLPAGARGAIQADASAKEQAKAALDMVSVPRADGSTVMMPRSQAAAVLSGGAGMGGGAAPGIPTPNVQAAPGAPLGVTQSPAAAKLQDARAENQAKLESDMQGAHAAMQQVDDQTNMVRQNLHDMLGETQDPQTGNWVKTKPSMIGPMSTGSATNVIEHIPFVNQNAQDLAAKIETVRNGTSFNSLQAIKNALSAAGNGSGASIRMTDQTARMLGEINGSLDQDQSSPQFEATVRRHLSQLDALDKSRHDLFSTQYANIQTPAPGNTGPQATAYAPRGPTVQGMTPDRHALLLAEARRRGLIH